MYTLSASSGIESRAPGDLTKTHKRQTTIECKPTLCCLQEGLVSATSYDCCYSYIYCWGWGRAEGVLTKLQRVVVEKERG